ncbi:hypothetical protein NLX83_40445 [Allokutzneria sp. A3M-2-11 16]|uniref:hypothetical protein n=1 Tax=Allokutzneria sp. A3M-2-11 16 TaxID=2962043 RepID=UPI0020B6AD10|nr:hypothetical protein [Allokutzneria sp. A3M-2-11 16]MCP3805553.1 hypothetical protein [Allokutzneria sp. A3M-2-11 16]
MTFDAETVAAWTDLPAAELRIQAQRLASARLPVDHPVWRYIRKDPALAAKLRGALSGLLTTIKGSRDEHMHRIWINAARTALSDKAVAPAPAKEKTREKAKAPAPRVEAQVVEQRVVEQPPAEQPKAASSVAPMLFQQPGKTSGDLS